MSEYFEIAYAAVANRLCLFTGTGFSKALSENGIPGWQELLEEICDNHVAKGDFKRTLFPAKGATPLSLEETAQVIDIELAKSCQNIHQVIAESIANIATEGEFPETEKFLSTASYRVITTNYDKLLEKIAGPECQTLTPGLPVPRSSSRVQAFHIHGSIDVPARMVVTSDDYFHFMNSDSYFSRKLSTVLHENTVVILGYSLGDANLKAILSDYKGFVRSHRVSSSIFFVSRSPVDQTIVDYYSNCYGIRVIDTTEVEQFFKKLNKALDEAHRRMENSIINIKKVLHSKHSFTDDFLLAESSFYEIVASIGAIGVSLNDENVVRTFGAIVDAKQKLTGKDGAWNQYEQLASWLTYLGTIVDVEGTSMENTYLKAVKYSMEHSSKEKRLGYSWHAYRVWESRWSSISAKNRIMISSFIREHSSSNDALSIASID